MQYGFYIYIGSVTYNKPPKTQVTSSHVLKSGVGFVVVLFLPRSKHHKEIRSKWWNFCIDPVWSQEDV